MAVGDPQYGGGTGSQSPAGKVPWAWGKNSQGQTVPLPATRAQVDAQLVKWFQGDKTDGITWPVLAKTLKAAGYPNNGSFGSVKKAWGDLLNDTTAMGGGTTVYSFLRQQVQAVQSFKGPSAGAAGAYMGPTSTTQITPEFDANALIDETLVNYLGREATAEEKSNFLKKLNSSEKANPQVRTPNGQHADTYTGGFSAGAAQDLAKQTAVAADDFAETAANTTGLKLFEQAIKGEGRMI